MREIRFAWRRLVVSPGFTLTAVLSLALGIGVNTAVFRALSAVLFRPLPVVEPERVVFLDRHGAFPNYSYPAFLDFSAQQRTLERLAAYRFSPVSLNVGGGQENSRAWIYLASGEYFPLLGVQPLLGRTYGPEDDRVTGGHPVVVLGYSAWQRRFGGNANAIGKTIRLNNRPYTVIGVMPRGFQGSEVFFEPELWVPLRMQPQIEQYNGLDHRGRMNYFVIGRLKAGVTKAQAETDLNAIAQRLMQAHPDTDAHLTMQLSPPGMLGKTYRGPTANIGWVLFAAASLVLLVACANLSGVLLARSADRQRETAIRLALGASRWQLMRQLMTESALLSLAGGFGALLFGMWAMDLALAWRPQIDFSMATFGGMDWRAFAFTLVVAMAASFLFGLMPARAAARVDLIPALKSDTQSRPAWRRFETRDGLVVLQIALSVVLVVAAGLIVASLRKASEVPLGMRPDGLYAIGMDLELDGYTRERRIQFVKELLRRARDQAGFESAAIGGYLPLSTERSHNTIEIEGRPQRLAERPVVLVYEGSNQYFATTGGELVEGRDFSEQDEKLAGRRFAVVNETFVKRLLDGGPGVGKRFFDGGNVPVEIVGVVRDGRYLSLGEEPRPVLFYQGYARHTTLVVRSRLAQELTLRRMRALVKEMDAGVTVFHAESMEEHLNWAMFPVRMSATLLSAIGALAMTLAAVGIYGVMSYAVARRTREIGVRVAIGASPRDIAALFAGRNAAMVGLGLALGLTAAASAARFAAPLLYRVDPYEPAAYLAAVAVVLAVAAVAGWQPARRAMRLSPVVALRQD